jgi:exodeoxyribonuclease V alpha subunit
MEGITFTIKNIRYHNDDNGYTVMDAVNELNEKTFTAVCNNMFLPVKGQKFTASGEWFNGKYGKEFRISTYKEEELKTTDAIADYLSSGLFKGIGPALSKKIVSHFGDDTVDIIENYPERLSEIKGLSKSKIDSLTTTWNERKCVNDTMIFFKEYGLTTNLILKLCKKYGCDAIKIIKENPYIMVDEIESIGFIKADNIAMKMGFKMDDPKRIYAGVKYVLNTSTEDGHTFLYNDELILKSCEILRVNDAIVKNTIQTLIEDGELIDICGKIFLLSIYMAENSIAHKLMAIKNHISNMRHNTQKTIEDVEIENGFKYNDLQKDAIRMALTSNIMILTGGPGTGKTTALKGIIEMLNSMELSIGAAAPTGKASKRMSEVTGLNAKTIHRMLEYNPYSGYGYNEENPLPYDVIIIDEMSMVNVPLMNILLKAISPSTKLILVGDVDQLPAIGAGNVLSDCIETKLIPTIRLTEIFRQEEDSEIILKAHAINHGKEIVINNSKPNNNFFVIKKYGDESIADEITSLVTTRLPNKYNVKPTDIQVLSPMRKYTTVGADEMNNTLQSLLNTTVDGIKVGKTTFKVGDKVMQTKNNYDKEVFNGDVGFITEIDANDKTITVDYDDNVIVYDKTDMDELVLAYVSTIHKSQGSEYPIVIIPITRRHSKMLQRNLIYTGITRSKEICILVGEPEMINYAIGNTKYSVRNTYLKELLFNAQ